MHIGIDLGTTFSLAAFVARDGVPTLIPDPQFRQAATPSTVWLGNQTALVGWQAEGKFEQAPEKTRLLSFFKRQIGTPEPIVTDANGNNWFPEAVSALVLKKIRHDAEKHLGAKLQGAVLTVPAHFNDLQRRSTQVAAALADIPLLDLLDEPVAAALHYGVAAADHHAEKIIFVYDLGGGTFDATVLSYHREAGIHVLAKDGHTHLGGREFDAVLQSYIHEQMEKETGPDFKWTGYAWSQLRKAAEAVKIELSDPERFFLRKNIFIGSWHKEMFFNRREFEAQSRSVLDQTVQISQRCLFNAKIPVEQIDAFLLVGGSSVMPAVREALIAGLEINPTKVKHSEPHYAIAYGAAIRAAQLSEKGLLPDLPSGFHGVTGYHMGVRSIDPFTGQPKIDILIRKNASLSSKGIKTYYTRSAQQTHILLDLVQYVEKPEDAIGIGQLVIGPLSDPRPNYAIEICLDHTPNGCIRIRATDRQTGKEVQHTFDNQDTQTQFFLQQKQLVDATMINNMGESER